MNEQRDSSNETAKTGMNMAGCRKTLVEGYRVQNLMTPPGNLPLKDAAVAAGKRLSFPVKLGWPVFCGLWSHVLSTNCDSNISFCKVF